MTDSRPVEEGHFGMILTKEEAALIMALRHVPEASIMVILRRSVLGCRYAQIDNERQLVERIRDIYEIKIKEGLGVTV